MYFITNSENYIVAADKNFLEKLGVDSVCAISSHILDGVVSKDIDGRLNIVGFEEKFQFASSTLLSPFGQLELYKLDKKVAIPQLNTEDENISYIKKIKDGIITTVDNEFNIPQISSKDTDVKSEEKVRDESSDLIKTTLKSETKEEISENLDEQIQEPIPVLKEEEPKIELFSDTVIGGTKESAKNVEKSLESTHEEKEILNDTIKEQPELEPEKLEPSLKVETKAETKEEKAKSTEDVNFFNFIMKAGTTTTADTKEPLKEVEDTETTTIVDIEEQPKEVVDTKELPKETEDTEPIIADTKELQKEAADTITTTIADTEEQPKEAVDTKVKKEKEKGFGLLKSKIFPWGSKYEEEIELEEPKEKDILKTANELEVEQKSEIKQEEKASALDEDLIPVIDIATELPKAETATEEVVINKQEPTTAQNELKRDKLEKIELNTIKDENKLIETAEEELEKKPEASAVSLEAVDKEQLIKTALKPVSEKEAFVNKISDEQKAIETDKEELEKEFHKSNQEQFEELDKKLAKEAPTQKIKEEILSQEELELLELKKIGKEQKPEVIQETKEDIEEVKNRQADTANNQILYQLIRMQAEGVDLKENAKRLSIDLSSYKMLLTNYLDELDNYTEELKSASRETVTMLADASELLSLDIVTKKLQKLLTAQDKSKVLKEITLLQSYLRQKLEGKKLKPAVKQEERIKPTIKTDTKKDTKVALKQEHPLQINEEEIEITSAQDLLNKVSRVDTEFDPNKAASDLNLPSSLILEFVDDFIDQTQEHLPQMVTAYKEKDIKTMQTTAHMLKGAASNLRLDTLSESLFKIQKIQTIEESENLLKDFVAKLKGLEYAVEHMEIADDEN